MNLRYKDWTGAVRQTTKRGFDRKSDAEEWVELDKRWKLLGYRTKQEYLIQSVLKSSVTAVGNMQMIYQFKQSLREILTELKRIEKAGDMDEELMTPVRTMLEIMEAANNQTVA